MKYILVIMLLGLNTAAFAETFAEADARCQARKNELLQRLRKEVIEECRQKREFGSEAGACENFYADYGNPIFDPQGFQVKKGLFDDIPECQRALELQITTERH